MIVPQQLPLIRPDRRVVLIDDVIASGGHMCAAAAFLESQVSTCPTNGCRASLARLTTDRNSAVVVSSCEESRIMDITVPKSLEALVRRKVEEGHYSTEDEVVADALRLMQARDEVAQIKRARLQDTIDRGYQDVAAGRVVRLETDDQIDAFFADL